MRKAQNVLAVVAHQVSRRRKAARLTQERLAELSGISVKMLSLIENASVSASITTLSQIASALDVTLVELLLEPDDVDRETLALLSRQTREARLRALAVLNAMLGPLPK